MVKTCLRGFNRSLLRVFAMVAKDLCGRAARRKDRWRPKRSWPKRCRTAVSWSCLGKGTWRWTQGPTSSQLRFSGSWKVPRRRSLPQAPAASETALFTQVPGRCFPRNSQRLATQARAKISHLGDALPSLEGVGCSSLCNRRGGVLVSPVPPQRRGGTRP